MRKLVLAVTICLLTFSLNVSAQDMIIDSNGNIGMGVINPDHGLHIAGINDALHIEGEAFDDNYSGGRLTFGDINWTYIEETEDDVLTIKASEVIFDTGVNGFGVSSPSAKLDVSDGLGYNQLILRTSFTPNDTNDPKGIKGSISWDVDYLYIKTSVGWKRAALSTWTAGQ